MKPQLLSVHTNEGKPHAFLVDIDSVSTRIEDGKERGHYLVAVDLRGCMAGQVELTKPDEKGVMHILAPNPCVLAVRKKGIKEIGMEARGLDVRAAVMMLKLAASLQNIQAPFNGSMTWSFGEPVERSSDPAIMAGATIEKIIAAWKWSFWQRERLDGQQRLADMKRIGYRRTPKALRDMMSDLGLVATKKR